MSVEVFSQCIVIVEYCAMDTVEKKGSSSKQINKGLRRSYDANFKIMVCNEAERTNNCAAARKYTVDEKNIRRWRNEKEVLKIACSTRKAFRGPKKGQHKDLDELVVKYIVEKRAEGLPITREVITLKALEIATEMGIPRHQFKASLGWCRRMMRRYGLTLRRRTTLAQRLPRDFDEKLRAYQKYVINLRKKNEYLMSQIGNADQTPVYFDMPSSVTVDVKGAKSVLVKSTGNEKSRITVMLAVTADGRKLPPYVILKRKTMPKDVNTRGLILRVQHKGWMDGPLVVDWLKVVWNRRPGALLRQRAMLVLDAFRGHLTEQVKTNVRDNNTDLVIIPGGMTSQLQVLDVVVNKPFKDKLRGCYTEWLLAGQHALTPTGKIKKPCVSLLCSWIMTAWNSISPESIVKGFKKCCLSNAMDGTEDDALWDNEDVDDNHDESESGTDNEVDSDDANDYDDE